MTRVWRAMLLAGAALLAPAAAQGQVYYQPQPRPLVTAEHERWYLAGEPITYEGYVYYLAGPQVYFDSNVMVRSGSYRGIPLYADTTREPYSIVLVPLAGGLLQPYERRRTGDAAGGTGTQAPSFPVDIAGERGADPQGWTRRIEAPSPPVFTQPDELVFEDRMADAASASRRAASPRVVERERAGPEAAREAPVATGGATAVRDVLEAGAKPKGLNEIYVTYVGARWRSAGMAVRLAKTDLDVIGDYHGHPVYAARGASSAGAPLNRIYLPGKPGFVAPYERAGEPVRY